MCTKYTLKDNPEIFKQFIPRNLSRTDLSNEDLQTKFAWCLMSYDNSQCQCTYPKLSKLINNRMGRKHLFEERIGKVNTSTIKDDDCWMCTGSKAYCPSDISIDNHDYRRSKSEINRKSNRIRKCVRFADALGLQLTEIKFIKETDNFKAPILTSSAVKDLHLDHNCHLGNQGIKYFSPLFKIVSDDNVLIMKTMENNVCLEKTFIEGMVLFGRILVKNLSFEKHVGIRITYDNWNSFKDIYSSYILESSNGIIDKFTFSVAIPRFVVVDSRIEFSVFYLSQNGNTYWDNNNNQNYIFECFAKNMGIVTDDGWLHFL